MERSFSRSVQADGREIHYCLERNQVRNLNLRIRHDGSVFVSANDDVPFAEIDEFVCRKASYILAAIGKFEMIAQYRPQPKQYVSGETFMILGRGLRLKVLRSRKDSIVSDGITIFLSVKELDDMEKRRRIIVRFLDRQCKAVFGEIIKAVYPMFRKYGLAMPTLRIREMETRWGSSLVKKGIITLNKRLLESPRNCIEYVVMHEFCHFIHPNHSKSFYGFLTMLMPDWRERKAILEKQAIYWL